MTKYKKKCIYHLPQILLSTFPIWLIFYNNYLFHNVFCLFPTNLLIELTFHKGINSQVRNFDQLWNWTGIKIGHKFTDLLLWVKSIKRDRGFVKRKFFSFFFVWSLDSLKVYKTEYGEKQGKEKGNYFFNININQHFSSRFHCQYQIFLLYSDPLLCLFLSLKLKAFSFQLSLVCVFSVRGIMSSSPLIF